jgi:shikimate dehydrogenase
MIRAAVLGSPISHSLSPRLHNAAYKFLGIEGEYNSFDVPAGNLQEFLANKESVWTGFSLTMPLKEEAMLCAQVVDPLVKRISSGNTLFNKDGQWHLYSTDVMGFQNVWKMQSDVKPSSILIIGSGATARAALAAFDSTQTRIEVLHRNPDREDSIRSCIEESAIEFHQWGFNPNVSDFDLIINTTPKYALDLSTYLVPSNPSGIFFDVIYNPWPTEFARIWQENGGKILGGLELLVAQGVQQVKIFTGADISTDLLSKHLRAEFNL